MLSVAILSPLVPVASVASVGRDFSDAADTTVRIANTRNATALVVDAGMGQGIEASGDLAIRASGSRVGLRAEAEYYGVEAEARNGAGIRARGATGGLAEGVVLGLAASGGDAGIHAEARSAGGVGIKAGVEQRSGIGAWGQAGSPNGNSSAAIGVAGYGMGDRSVGVSGVTDGDGAVSVLGSAFGGGAFAGYFEGDVVVTGACAPCVPADTALQGRGKPLAGALAKILALKPRSYEVSAGDDGAKNGSRTGFSAHEIEAVLPGVVRRVAAPAARTPAEQWNSAEPALSEYAAISYQELIPLLVRAIQEQQAEIEALKKKR